MRAATTGLRRALGTGATSVIRGRRPTRAAGRSVRRKALPRMAAFRLVAVMLGFVLLTSAAVSPLYAVYQAQWRFSAATLTAVFAIYAILLLARVSWLAETTLVSVLVRGGVEGGLVYDLSLGCPLM
jgi:uncharacterized membrane protein YdfJ with MMPL/SSD domain